MRMGRSLHQSIVCSGWIQGPGHLSCCSRQYSSAASANTEEPLDAGTVKLTKMTVEDFPRHLQVDDFGVGAYSGLGFTWVSYHQLLVDYHMETQRKALHQWP